MSVEPCAWASEAWAGAAARWLRTEMGARVLVVLRECKAEPEPEADAEPEPETEPAEDCCLGDEESRPW